ncbi:ketosynthase chain-length factor [Kitasatospora sp. NPDC002551]|uniref:ketosynthase chain-length factor n=1 Tax=Kitasatospora sp. NPDC002551 TaxID=3154539 RepID=UPI003331FF39
MSTTVITGIGVVAPNGLGTEAYWSATLAGTSGIAELTRFDASEYPVRLAGEVPGFEPAEHLPSRLLPQTDHMTRLALAAADWALEDAEADPAALGEYQAGVVTSATLGGFEFGQRELQHLWSQGPGFVSAYQSFAWFYAVNTGQISIRNDLRGPSGVLVSDQAGGLDAMAHARRGIRKGHPMMVTGGVDSALCPYAWTPRMGTGEMTTVAEADRAYLPFDEAASGYVAGEGGAILIAEDAESARARGVERPYGEIAGYGSTFDPPRGSGRPRGLARAIRLALADAGLEPGRIDVVFADADGRPQEDADEAAALNEVFGTGGVAVTAPKTMTGRLGAGGAPLDVAAALLSIRDGLVPPTVNLTSPRHGLDLVLGEARSMPVKAALVLARGRHGFNSAMVLRACA